MMQGPPDDPGLDPADKPVRTMSREEFIAALIVVLILFFLIVFGMSKVRAQEHKHNAADPRHWYEMDCCNLDDCQPVPSDYIKETRGGYAITIPPGGHKKWPATQPVPLKALMPYSSKDVRQSQDQNWHVCANASRILCVYARVGGV